MGQPTLIVKSDELTTKASRETTAKRVIHYFGQNLPESRLLCFLDDENPMKGVFGIANRGFYIAIHDDTPLADLPECVQERIYVDDGRWYYPRVIDDLVYLHGSTCSNEIGLTMTLSHEIQHAIQHANQRQLWAANSLVFNLEKKIINRLKLTWGDIPIELEARIMSKRVAESIFGKQKVMQFIDKKIAEQINDDDVADWQFVRTLEPSSSADLISGTQRLFERLENYRAELDGILREKKSNPDFENVSLDAYFAGIRE